MVFAISECWLIWNLGCLGLEPALSYVRVLSEYTTLKASLDTEHPTYLRLVPVCVHSLHIQVDGLYSAASEKNNSYVYKHSG